MADIFISYKREDRPAAQRIANALEHLGFDVWWDFELMSGDRYRRVIEKVIDECRAAIVLWSPASRESPFVVDEATYAREQNKLCPVKIVECRPPLGFGGEHIVNLTAWRGDQADPMFQSIVHAVEVKTGKRARAGAAPRDSEGEARSVELDAFKAAQIAGTITALRTFLRAHANGAFAGFVREQIATMEEDARAAAPRPASAPPPRPAPVSPHRPAPVSAPVKKQPPWIAIGLGVVAVVAVALLVMQQNQPTGANVAAAVPAGPAPGSTNFAGATPNTPAESAPVLPPANEAEQSQSAAPQQTQTASPPQTQPQTQPAQPQTNPAPQTPQFASAREAIEIAYNRHNYSRDSDRRSYFYTYDITNRSGRAVRVTLSAEGGYYRDCISDPGNYVSERMYRKVVIVPAGQTRQDFLTIGPTLFIEGQRCPGLPPGSANTLRYSPEEIISAAEWE